MAATSETKNHPFLSTHPVFVPHEPALFFDEPFFDAYVASLGIRARSTGPSTGGVEARSNTFMTALNSRNPELPGNLALTDNGAITHESAGDPLLDLFTELESVVLPTRLRELLVAAWAQSPQDTLKIIWNARSIPLGKADRTVWYRCMGWLKEYHPRTVLKNLEWAVRPIVEKKVKEKSKGEGDGMVIVGKDGDMDWEDEVQDEATRHDVRNGISHGYYCDLLNLLHLAVKDKLRADVDPKPALSTPKMKKNFSKRRQKERSRFSSTLGLRKQYQCDKPDAKTLEERKQEVDRKNAATQHEAQKLAKEQRRKVRKEAHENFVMKYTNDPFYRALHLRIARIFAEQIQRDAAILESGKGFGKISLASKWAPSLEGMHDRSTFVASTIAELLFPPEKIGMQSVDREEYLKHARQRYRKLVSALRKALDVVEIKISMRKFSEIYYNRIPSLAMNRYSELFATQDFERFEAYLDDVASGKANISGAALLPSTLINKVRCAEDSMGGGGKGMLEQKILGLEAKASGEQWKTLVQRIKDSGTLDNAIAVVDVSGSMLYPTFSDHTTPMDSSVGLGLLVASAAKPPFRGTFITFSSDPEVVQVDLEQPLGKQVSQMLTSSWGMSTDFNAVFERLLLPMAVNNNIPKEDMVKRIFVFSDMQFNEASDLRFGIPGAGFDEAHSRKNFETNYERIKRLYEEAGYDMPEMVFWNLAGGRNDTAPKPVTKDAKGTALVSGYSQGMLKVLLDGGSFDGGEEDAGKDEGDGVKKQIGPLATKGVKKRIDPLATVMKAIGHKSYEMLEVVD